LVVHDEHLARLDLVEAKERGDAPAAFVHVRGGLEHPEIAIALLHARDPAGEFRLLRPARFLAPGDGIHPPIARVVARALVFASRIAQPHDEAYRFHLNKTPAVEAGVPVLPCRLLLLFSFFLFLFAATLGFLGTAP